MTQSPQFLPKLSEVTSEQKDVLILSLLKRIAELERRLGLNSQNSHKLPSSDGLARAPQSLLHTSNLPVRRQVGHSGKTLKKSSPIEHVVVHPLAQHCHVCGADLGILPQQEAKERRQVIDLPALRFEVKAHRIMASRCTNGEDHQSNFPPKLVSAVQYGAQIRATALYLHYYHQLPFVLTTQTLQALFGVIISPSTLVNIVLQTAQYLQPVQQCIQDASQGAAVVHADQTGLRSDGHLRWVQVVSNASLTWVSAHAQRGHGAMEHFQFLLHYIGIVVHDGLPAYRQYGCSHALCNAHLMRELNAVQENGDQVWSGQLIGLLCAVKDEVQALREDASIQALPPECYQSMRQTYVALIQQSFTRNPPKQASRLHKKRGRVKQSAACNLLRRMQIYAEDILRFCTDFRTPFDNNQAARDLRMVMQRKKNIR